MGFAHRYNEKPQRGFRGKKMVVPLGFNRISVPFQTSRSGLSLASSSSLQSKYEQQLTTQVQYQYGSDSPYNASTTLAIQAQIERKIQNTANLKSSQNFLTASDSVLSKVATLTNDAQAMASNAINTLTTAEERSSLAQSVKQIVQQFFNFGNSSYEGRYLFAGSTTDVIPFSWGTDSSYTINYLGNESGIFSWSDTDILTKSNTNGVEIFGAISEPVRGKVDLNPAISGSTLLSDLNGGRGIEKGFIQVTYSLAGNSTTYEVDLSKCVSLSDVKRQLESKQNPNFSLKVDFDDNGLVISLPDNVVGSVKITESGRGTTAKQLGIPTNIQFNRENKLVCNDLNPALVSTSSLSSLLGSRASAALSFAGANNDIYIESKFNGETYIDSSGNAISLNGVNFAIQADSNIVKGEESASYDAVSRTVTIKIHPDNTTANDIINAINKASDANVIPPFSAKLSQTDKAGVNLDGTGIVSYLPGFTVTCGVTSGGSGGDLDLSGIELTNGNKTFNISFADCKTVGDMLAKLNDPQYGISATINDSKSGIDIRSRVSGADFCIGENGGATASQLGIRTVDSDTLLAEFDYGRGVSDYDGAGEKAVAYYSSVTSNSGLTFNAKSDGKEWNDYTIKFTQTTDINGKTIVSIDEETKTLNVAINSGVTTANEVIEAFNTQPGAKQFFDLQLDQTDGLNNGEGVIYLGEVKTGGGTNRGIDFTITRNDGVVLEIDVKGAKTAGDILRLINDNDANTDRLLVARLSEFGNGIELVDSSFGEKVTRVDRSLLSTSAIELGLVDYGEEYKEKTGGGGVSGVVMNGEVLNGSLFISANYGGGYAEGVSVEFVDGGESFVWDASSRTLRFGINAGVTTANDVIRIFQERASEQARSMFTIQGSSNVDGTSSSGEGLVSVGVASLAGGTDVVLKGNDPNPKEVESLFGAMIRLQNAMEKNDTREIERSALMLSNSIDKLNGARTTVGVMLTSLDNVQDQLSNENVRFQSTLDTTYYIDYADASLSYLAHQLSYQASLQVTASMFQMSLLNYL
jgi:flagellin-like hook-associated protein FlgL